MATYAARRLLPMIENLKSILAIELMAASQGIDFRRPLTSSPPLERVHQLIRGQVPFLEVDRPFYGDIQALVRLIESGQIRG